ncbi:hypothetical protein GCM10010520_23000 [Rhizobium viscosum]|uniref:DUF4365 domain-containing protein n=1 Tax=Rhizobium viscosum TaxID=1673 RepID=A0ABR9IIS0_RHIVS|nr:hypothetical protein [Rhizobium viscosum]MBE1503074.1 hypothetical protein [Rhizobium viscosum]
MSNARPLNADTLGELGEAAFGAMCAKAGLVANKATRDRAGWDFRVEVPNSALPTSVPADKRAIPDPFVFQIKTMWHGGTHFTASLISLERLAKSSEPAFILVLTIDEDRNERDAFLIHMGDKVLDLVLKRLTRDTQKGGVTNRQKVRLSKDASWLPVPLVAEDIIAAGRDICVRYAGSSIYAIAKDNQLRKAGYGPYPFKVSMTVEAASTSELIQAALGLKPLRATNMYGTEERFGITRPLSPPMGTTGTITVTPTKGHDCRLFFRKDKSSIPVTRSGDIFAPALRVAEFRQMQFLVKSDPLKMHLLMSGTFNLDMPDLRDERKPIGWWKEIYDIFDILSCDNGSIEVYVDGMTKLFAANNISASFGADDRKRISHFHKVITAADALLKRTGHTDLALTFDDIITSQDDILTCIQLITEIGTTFSCDLDSPASTLDVEFDMAEPGVFIQALKIGPISIHYCACADIAFRRTEMDGAILEGTTTQSGILRPDGGEDIYKFSEICAREAGAKCRITFEGFGKSVLQSGDQ